MPSGVTKNFFNNQVFLGASAEDPETLNPAGSSLPLNEVIGAAGNAGGLYDPNNNYSFNLAPDIIAKAAFEPGQGKYGHDESLALPASSVIGFTRTYSLRSAGRARPPPANFGRRLQRQHRWRRYLVPVAVSPSLIKSSLSA